MKQSGDITGIDVDPIITLTGYSGGGLTSEWTAELQPTYAPDINIVGIALGGLVPNLSASTEYVNGGLFSSLGPPGIVGLSHDYQNLSTWLDENLVPSTKAKFMQAGSQCITSNAIEYAFEDIGDYFIGGYAALSEPVPASILAATGLMGLRSTPTIPLYLYEVRSGYLSDRKRSKANFDLDHLR